jgi:hypothetical protein
LYIFASPKTPTFVLLFYRFSYFIPTFLKILVLLSTYFSTQGCQKAWGSEVAHIFDTFPEKDKGKDNDYSRAAELFFYRRKI